MYQPTDLKKGTVIQIDGQPFRVTDYAQKLPKNLFLAVTYTEDVVKGDTTSSVQKDATLETGKVIKVPAFIKVGDVVKVDTRDGSYLERQK